MHKNIFAEKIIGWYYENKRLLPWRETNDPYKIWLSEIILQQTRVSQGLPYYLKFVDHFPDVVSLAKASEQEILRLWQGLGYYSRARNLHRCAKKVMQEHQGQFPRTFVALQKLPGIGTYTAAAIASFAFKEPVAVIDGNVFRIMARYFGIEKDIALPQTKTFFFDRAMKLIPADRPDDFNQAIMEFGATCCTPKNPACGECVLQKSCVAYARGLQSLLPVKTKKIKQRKRYFYYFVIQQDKKLVLQKRTGKDIWHGLYDFHSVESSRPENVKKILLQSGLLGTLAGKIEIGEPSEAYKHVLSHQILTARFIPVTVKPKKTIAAFYQGKKVIFYTARAVHRLPKPVLVSKHLARIGFL